MVIVALPVFGVLSTTTKLVSGASYENVLTRVPTTAETVTVTECFRPTPTGAAHWMTELLVHVVVMQIVVAVDAVGVRSVFTKFSPMSDSSDVPATALPLP